MAEPAGIGGADLLTLTAWLSPAFPVGGFAFSHGLEWAVECGDVADDSGVRQWIGDLLRLGSGRDDAILLASAHKAAKAGDDDALRDVAELALAMQPSAERRLETGLLGNAFVKMVDAAWLPGFRPPGEDVAYPVAVGTAAAMRGLPIEATVQAFLSAFVASLLSAAIRLGPIGQTDGQRILSALIPVVLEVAAAAGRLGPDDLGGCVFRSDIASMRHETQYTRLFRS
jgi:urease accessory protein